MGHSIDMQVTIHWKYTCSSVLCVAVIGGTQWICCVYIGLSTFLCTIQFGAD